MADIRMDGNTAIWWVPTIADTAAPTDDEITAGVRLEGFITDADGFTPEQADIDTTVLNSTAEFKMFGLQSVNPALTMKRTTADTAWDTFEEEDEGFLVQRTGVASGTAPAAAQTVDVLPVVSSLRQKVKRAKNDIDKFVVKFGLRDNPQWDVAIVAGV